MSKIRPKNTKPEMMVFRELRKRKIYFQKHYKNAIGSPDVALPKKKKAVFIDGDFWHGRNFKKNKKRLPKKYWQSKIEENIVRDKKNRAKLKRQGWKILRVWEGDLNKSRDETIKKVLYFMKYG